MPAPDRAEGRDVFIFDGKDRLRLIGGLILAEGMTYDLLYEMVDVIAVMNEEWHLESASGSIVPRDNQALMRSNYYIITTGDVLISNEEVVTRTISQSGTGQQGFRSAVCERDQGCAISKLRVVGNNWRPFVASHVFPIGLESYWRQHNYSRWITVLPENGSAINSVQNGLLLQGGIHSMFDSFDLSINPDDRHKIIAFQPDPYSVSGTYLEQDLIDNPRGPSSQLLRWHFRQAVLTNMRGAGEPIFEHDFPPGSEIMGDIMSGPKAEERMEFELHNRLAPFGGTSS